MDFKSLPAAVKRAWATLVETEAARIPEPERLLSKVRAASEPGLGELGPETTKMPRAPRLRARRAL